MSSIDDTQAAIDALENPAETEPEEAQVESGADDGAAESTEERLYAGKYKTVDELERGAKEAEQQFHATRQEIAELKAQLEQSAAPQEAFDPWAQIGTGLDEETSQLLYNRVYHNPQGMMEWAMQPETQRQFGPQIADQVYATWAQLAPWAAQQFAAQYTASQTIQPQRQELEQMRADWTQEQNTRQASNARALIEQNIPDFEQYKARVVELMDTYPLADDHPLAQSPEGLAQHTEQLYGIARWEEFKRQEAAAQAQQAQVPAKGSKARTQTRSTATPTADFPEDVQGFMDEVLAGQPGRNQ